MVTFSPLSVNAAAPLALCPFSLPSLIQPWLACPWKTMSPFAEPSIELLVSLLSEKETPSATLRARPIIWTLPVEVRLPCVRSMRPLVFCTLWMASVLSFFQSSALASTVDRMRFCPLIEPVALMPAALTT